MVCRVNHGMDDDYSIHMILNKIQVEDEENSIGQVDSSPSDAFINLCDVS